MSIFEKEIDIEKYIELYNLGVSIKSIKPLDNQTYKILMMSTTDIRVIDRKEVYSQLMFLEKIKHFTIDTKQHSNRFFYMIPLQTPKGTIVGFIFRSVFGKSYATVCKPFKDKNKKVPYMYGFYKDFATFDKHDKCPPIVVCEGLKDCILMKKIYPYVLANNTSSLGLNAYVLRNLSNKFILVYDNDETGNESVEIDKKNLRNIGCYVDSVKIEDGFKDCSDYISDPQALKRFKDKLVKKIKLLKNN